MALLSKCASGRRLAVEPFFGNLFKRRELVDARVVHQHVEPAERFLRFGKDALDIGGFRHIALYRAPSLLEA